MDDDTLRRGRPTSHVVFGEGLAILAGDGLLTEAFALMAREPADARSAPAPGASCARSGSSPTPRGRAGWSAGRRSISRRPDRGAAFDGDGLRAMHARKTGALIRASAAAGAVMAGADEAQLAAIERFASELGLAFQIVDDILDVEGASEALGKTAGKDAAAGKPTYPALYGLDASRPMAAECVDRALAALEGRGSGLPLGGQLPAIARWVTQPHELAAKRSWKLVAGSRSWKLGAGS